MRSFWHRSRSASRALASAFCLWAALGGCSPAPRFDAAPPEPLPLPKTVLGMNLRPVGDARHGYGTRTARHTLARIAALGANTVGILIEGRLSNAKDPVVLGPGPAAVEAARLALLDARHLGLATVLVPHLYVEDGTWRGDLSFSDQEDQATWWRTYGDFAATAAAIARDGGASLLSIGVELKAMSSDPDAAKRMRAVVEKIRSIHRGPITYTANWDEAEAVLFWDMVDVPGVNGYYPLEPTPERGAEAVARQLRSLAARAGGDVLLVEVGFRASPLSHLRPWEWPEQVAPRVDEGSQARAWAAVLTHWLGAPGVRGLMAWVVPTDPDDPASEPAHGFNPLNKAAEEVIGRAYMSGGR